MFKFKLQQVLDYRSQLEDQAKMALGRALAELASQRKIVDDLKAETAATLARGCGQAIAAAERWMLDNYLRRLKADLANAEGRLNELDLEVHRCRSDLLRKSQSRQLLAKLRDKQREKYDHDEALKEQYALDEMAATRREIHTV